MAVPSPDFAALVPTPNGQGRRVFAASAKTDTADRWRRYRSTATQLPSRVLDRLAELDATRG